jgi:hypothetical protein
VLDLLNAGHQAALCSHEAAGMIAGGAAAQAVARVRKAGAQEEGELQGK